MGLQSQQRRALCVEAVLSRTDNWGDGITAQKGKEAGRVGRTEPGHLCPQP